MSKRWGHRHNLKEVGRFVKHCSSILLAHSVIRVFDVSGLGQSRRLRRRDMRLHMKFCRDLLVVFEHGPQIRTYYISNKQHTDISIVLHFIATATFFLHSHRYMKQHTHEHNTMENTHGAGASVAMVPTPNLHSSLFSVAWLRKGDLVHHVR